MASCMARRSATSDSCSMQASSLSTGRLRVNRCRPAWLRRRTKGTPSLLWPYRQPSGAYAWSSCSTGWPSWMPRPASAATKPSGSRTRYLTSILWVAVAGTGGAWRTRRVRTSRRASAEPTDASQPLGGSERAPGPSHGCRGIGAGLLRLGPDRVRVRAGVPVVGLQVQPPQDVVESRPAPRVGVLPDLDGLAADQRLVGGQVVYRAVVLAVEVFGGHRRDHRGRVLLLRPARGAGA